MLPILGPILSIGEQLIDRLWPDPAQAAQAKLELAKLAQQGELQELQTQMSAILAEAQSHDPWTSRARPSFLYVVYLLILASIPMGMLAAVDPERAAAIAQGMRAWLAAIPEGLWTTFGIGYTGYAVARSWDKTQALRGMKEPRG